MREFTKMVHRSPRNMGGCDIGHRFQSRKLSKMIERDGRNRKGSAAKRAEECSPPHKPWVGAQTTIKPRRGERTVCHTSGNILLHMIFSTHGRRPLIKSDFRAHLVSYFSGILPGV